ncbi:HIT-like protein [Trametes versicolor FP-101664 SS1]|uniref:HIT-like protein n=1 Tax=Trametes versicolor (strain FP-101664) TaxID=717944 RepID=UPI0004623E09|nr:HIT-like protein [Trametes versicolor FP-101664 SS1]EIW64863.1 HIT-like protein [Trametes versicolor FP-101664 SS1]
MSALLFASFDVSRQAFYRTRLAAAIVNLKPIVPGHVLVIPTRVVPRLADLKHDELGALMTSVQHVARVIERVYGADGLTIACQDGKAAGQTVPHVHFHLLPRKLQGDTFERNDEVYPALEQSEGELPAALRQVPQPLQMDADEDRKPRSLEDMEKEALWLKEFFDAAAEAQPDTDGDQINKTS